MKANIKITTLFFIGAISCIWTSCQKMDATYKDFLKGGEHRYSAKPDSVHIYPGNNRIKLSWLIISDPNVTRCKVFWNDGNDSLVVSGINVLENDTVNVMINNIDEGDYDFVIYTYDRKGNSSIPVDTSAHVYGDIYENSLLNRKVKEAVTISDRAKISWYAASDKNAVGTELVYEDAEGATDTIWVPVGESVTELSNKPLGDSLRFRTLFLPEPSSIDTFYTPYETIVFKKLTAQLLDKSKFEEYSLPTDAAPAYGSHPMSYLWDGSITGNSWFRTADKSGSPHWYTIDMGVEADLDHCIIWQRGTDQTSLLYANANPSLLEIWGADSPDPKGSWNGWTRLIQCEITKPSGLPRGKLSDEDKKQAEAGSTFIFPKDIPPVRYIRIKVLQTWDNKMNDHSFLSEISLWGIVE